MKSKQTFFKYINFENQNRAECKVNKKGLFILFFILCFIFVMNMAMPLIVDDYFVSHVSSYKDLYTLLKNYYLTWGGRIPGSAPVIFFLWKGKEYFNFVNAFMFTFLVAEIYWISNKGKISFAFEPSFIIGIFFSLWAFNASFIDTCLWLSGSGNYLWMMVIVLGFLMPYVRNLYDRNFLQVEKLWVTAGMFFWGILAGCSHESTICWLILCLAYWLYLCNKNRNLKVWQISGFLGICLGYGLLVFAPGNFVRIASQSDVSSVAITSQISQSFYILAKILYFKLIEIGIIFYFHMFLWYVIISYLLQSRKIDFYQDFKSCHCIVKACVLVAVGSALILFFIPTAGLRPSFLSLVFLTIAVSSIFRAQKDSFQSVISDKALKVTKRAGCCYLVVTMILSLWCNCLNIKQWNEVLRVVRLEHNQLVNNVLEVEPYFTDRNNSFWLVGTGFHLIDMPITEDVSHFHNKLVAKFYGIKGIRKK